MDSNPLSKYFRQPSIYIRLPSGGRFWNEGALDMPINNEIPVLPMTMRDEITLKTPDALMNGAGVVSVIQSCCPNIKDAWNMPSIDIDYVLIAIRIASIGHAMDFDSKCPHCGEENSHSVDLRSLLDKIVCPDYTTKVEYGNLKFKIKPQPYFGKDRGNQIEFEEQKMMAALNAADLEDDVRATHIQKSMERIIKLGIDNVVDSTEYVELDDGTIVSSPVFIKEFYTNAPRDLLNEVQTTILATNKEAALKPLETNCTVCEKKYSIPLEFNYSNFFVKGF